MASPRRGPVKVVLIDTRYVKADPTSFKSVVQSLTGKDSCVAWVESSSFHGTTNNTTTTTTTTHEINKGEIKPDHDVISSTNNGNGSSFMFSRGMSFKDLDRMLLEMPPLADLQYWLSDNQ
ncbi:hypothetical protein L484_021654 [Morus notabilis]|uniref:VQ domain-containing protein n=1 Tax=Morus notabilis TaxID=981085 RepID=W9S6L9_9ROSA|nr:VQ motif-containing protein 10 [Morus notabilis]EXC29346.1 hypothetical protein L484_021654 [Morus notabilis]